MVAQLPDALPRARSVLVVCAHPDDESFGLGAVLDRFVANGARVGVLCFTRGEASTLGAAAGDLGEIRRAELGAAAAELGIGRVELGEYPDGSLSSQPLDGLAADVGTMASEVEADLLVVLDEGGITGHPDHQRATEAALAGAPLISVLAWTLPRHVADTLNGEFGANFAGRGDEETDLVVEVDRTRQRYAIACHKSQSSDNPVLWRRLELLGDTESLRWLRRAPAPVSSGTHATLAREWDERYVSTERLFRAEPDETLVEVVAPLRPGRAVDLGAGEGRNTLWLAARGWEVTAIDLSKEALGRLERAASSRGLAVKTVVGDLTAHLSEGHARSEKFDLVVLAYVHPEAGERATLLRTAVSAVAPGGHLFVVGHHRFTGGFDEPFDASRLYAEANLQGAIDGLEVLRLEHRYGKSDVTDPGTDLALWARRH